MSENLEVYFDKQLVGHFATSGAHHVGQKMIAITISPDIDEGIEGEVSTLQLPLRIRKVVIDHLAIAQSSDLSALIEERGIPSYAQVLESVSNFAKEFYWSAIYIEAHETGLYRELFDLDGFEPLGVPEPKISGMRYDKMILDDHEPKSLKLIDYARKLGEEVSKELDWSFLQGMRA